MTEGSYQTPLPLPALTSTTGHCHQSTRVTRSKTLPSSLSFSPKLVTLWMGLLSAKPEKGRQPHGITWRMGPKGGHRTAKWAGARKAKGKNMRNDVDDDQKSWPPQKSRTRRRRHRRHRCRLLRTHKVVCVSLMIPWVRPGVQKVYRPASSRTRNHRRKHEYHSNFYEWPTESRWPTNPLMVSIKEFFFSVFLNDRQRAADGP